MEIQPWIVQVLASIIGGGLAGGILTIAYNWWTAKQCAIAQEKAAIAALIGERQHSAFLCRDNTLVEAPKAFMPLPFTVAQKVAFGDRHNYPRLKDFQKDIEIYALAVLQVNQFINLYKVLLGSGVSENDERARKLDSKVVSICKGDYRLSGGYIAPLPILIDNLKNDLERLSNKIS